MKKDKEMIKQLTYKINKHTEKKRQRTKCIQRKQKAVTHQSSMAAEGYFSSDDFAILAMLLTQTDLFYVSLGIVSI
jgi:CRISPR/Cas system-associated endonuclease Cas1